MRRIRRFISYWLPGGAMRLNGMSEKSGNSTRTKATGPIRLEQLEGRMLLASAASTLALDAAAVSAGVVVNKQVPPPPAQPPVLDPTQALHLDNKPDKFT